MKIIKALFGILTITMGLSATAQTFKVLRNFLDGIPPNSLMLSGNTLYGTTFGQTSGSTSISTAFKVNTDGTGFTTLYTYSGFHGADREGCPYGLVISGNTMYAADESGGAFRQGSVFKVNNDGTGFSILHTFNCSDACGPRCLILSSNTLYGIFGYSSTASGVFSLELPPPQMAIIPSQGNVILTWPTNTAEFSLKSTTNLVSPAVWTTVFPGPAVVNGQNAVTNRISDTRQFFRLNQQFP